MTTDFAKTVIGRILRKTEIAACCDIAPSLNSFAAKSVAAFSDQIHVNEILHKPASASKTLSRQERSTIITLCVAMPKTRILCQPFSSRYSSKIY